MLETVQYRKFSRDILVYEHYLLKNVIKKKQGCVLSEGSLWQATEATEYSLTDDFYL